MIATTHHAPLAKLGLLAGLILRPGIWDAQAQAWSRLIPHDWPGDYVDHWTRMVERGDAESFDAIQDGRRVGFLLVTVCHEFDTPELILLGAYAVSGGHDLTLSALPQIEAIARAKGCATVRFHTMRPGLIGKALRDGFTVSEVILRKDVLHVV